MKTKVFCFPYAGGSSAMLYNKWTRFELEHIELVPVELSGRGQRLADPLHHQLDAVVEDVYQKIKEQLTGAPFALFGHSMGSLIAYELYHYLQRKGSPLPVHIFFSGGAAPHVYSSQGVNKLSDKKFLSIVKKYGGIQSYILQNEELLELYLPIIKADFEVVDSFNWSTHTNKLDCDISILYGTEDKAVSKSVAKWGEYTNGSCSLHTFEGGHFYLHDQASELCRVMDATFAKANASKQ